jgi:hypothetical protein
MELISLIIMIIAFFIVVAVDTVKKSAVSRQKNG